MSWGFNFIAESPAAAKAHIEALKEPTPEQNYGTPRAAKDLVLDALDLAGIAETYSVSVSASGHTPGTARVSIEQMEVVRKKPE